MEKNKAYIKFLISQFKSATGTKNIDFESEGFISDFNNWIKSRQDISQNYLSMLDCMGLQKITESSTIEIEKGKFDTIVKPFDTTIITPYSDGLSVSDESRIITSEFIVHNGMPILYKLKGTNVSEVKPILSDSTLTFMTQNPYTEANIRDWDQLHNIGKNDIIVGVYGSIYDKDIKSKLKQIRKLEEKLGGTYIQEDAVIGDTYCYAIASKKEKEKVKVKIKTR